MPLERALSKLGIASRTQAREWILAGRVSVNGVVRRDPAYGVSPERAVLEIDGRRVARAEWRTFILHKPRGVVTTRSDEKGRPTVFSLIKEPGLHLIAVGRLDWATSGLLILTNDTRLSDWLTDPEHEVGRTYLVTVRGEMLESELERLRQGIRDDGDLLRVDEAVLRKSSRRESHLTVRLHEGKNREIRRIFLALGHEVSRLKRVAYGGLELGELEPGEYREITREEMERLFPGMPASKS
ncbi:MAG: pseudouridine synthase [Oligoflexia bacterium]|nr:pseudouridine synthase [Oligoflexia bacterium]